LENLYEKNFFIIVLFIWVSVAISAENVKIIMLEWDVNQESSVIGYNLYRSTVKGEYNNPPINSKIITELTYKDTITLPLDKTLYYTITATNGILESPKSNEVVLEQPSAPTL